jgi:hypothetical protein
VRQRRRMLAVHEREKRGLERANWTRPREKMGESSVCERARREASTARWRL